MKTKDRILMVSQELFNKHGATEVTTNDIAKELKMSPGNLYFHYKNKEQIIREIFKKMILDAAKVWKPQAKIAKRREKIQLVDIIDKNVLLYWRYRFFHRELYILRKKDPELSKLWHRYIDKTTLMMKVLYRYWVKAGIMEKIESQNEMEYLLESLFVSTNSAMHFFATSDRGDEPTTKAMAKARHYLIRLLYPYMSSEYQKEFSSEVKLS